MANNLADTYHYLPKAIAFVKRTSVQNAMDIFLDNPADFLAQINHT
jgi:hypothetical protein